MKPKLKEITFTYIVKVVDVKRLNWCMYGKEREHTQKAQSSS